MSKQTRSAADWLAEMQGEQPAKQVSLYATSPDTFPPFYGVVYAVVNPAWPGCVKLGKAYNMLKRYRQYQGYDPFMAYQVIGYSDVRLTYEEDERALHAQFAAQRIAGTREWFRITEAQALAALNTLRTTPLTEPVAQPSRAEPMPDDDWYNDGE